MAIHDLRNNFTGGEISLLLDARIDLQKYTTSCRRLENMRVMPYGGVTFRSGSLYISEAKSSSSSVKSRLIPFIYSTSVTYVIELGNLVMRFFRDGARIETAPGVAYEIASPFTTAELFEVQFKQINDVMYLVHPSHTQRKIARVTDTSWTTADVVFNYPALLDENTTTVTLSCSNTTGSGRTLTASSATFAAGHVGAYFELKHLRAAGKVELDIDGSVPTTNTQSSNLKVKGDWTLVTTERWYGVLNLQRSTDAGSTWQTFRTFTARADRNVSVSGFQADDVLFRLDYTVTDDPYGAAAWAGTAPTTFVKARAALEVAETYIPGLVLVTAFTNSTTATCSVINTLEATTATKYWSEGAWSTYQGFPRTVGLFEQRLFFAGTTRKPNTIWGSVTGDFENYQFGETDDAAVAYQLAAAQQNPIQWIETLLTLIAGTSGGEHVVSSGNGEEPLTPSNVAVRDPAAYGSEFFQAVKVENAIIFLQRQGRRIRELRDVNNLPNNLSGGAIDLCLLAEHLTTVGIRQLAYARLPDPTLYAVLGNGQMAVMTYDRDQNVNGWARFFTDGSYESVAALPGATSDTVYVTVKRTINGVTKRYVEVFTAETITPFSWVHMDSAKTFTGPLTTVTGLDHLEGKTVAVVAGGDGHVVGDPYSSDAAKIITVSGGSITLPSEELFIRVGLPYRGRIVPTRIDANLSTGTSQGRKRRISELCIRFFETIGGTYGTGFTRDIENGIQMSEIPWRTTESYMDQGNLWQSGDIVVPWEDGAATQVDVQISQTQALPMTVLGIFAKFEVFGE